LARERESADRFLRFFGAIHGLYNAGSRKPVLSGGCGGAAKVFVRAEKLFFLFHNLVNLCKFTADPVNLPPTL
jgi:hypothetical protein